MSKRARMAVFAVAASVAVTAAVQPWPARAVVEGSDETPGQQAEADDLGAAEVEEETEATEVEPAGTEPAPETTTTEPPQTTTTTAVPATSVEEETTTTSSPAPAPAAGDSPSAQRPAPPPPAAASTERAPARAPGPKASSTQAADLPDPLPPAGGDGTAVPPDHREPFPTHLLAMTNSVERTGAADTRSLLLALQALGDYGITPEQAVAIGFGRFPVGGEASYSHDWWFPRFGPGWRLHEGTDIFAAAGTPVRAPASGRARISNGGLGGLAVYVVEPDGTYYYLAHLAATAPGLVDGMDVVTGQVVGYVGDSGNAQGGLPHVHFEVHPLGGGPVDPKPVLDGYLADALAAVAGIVERHAQAAAAGSEGPAAAPPPVSALIEPPRAALLWASAANPTGGALRLAEEEALRAATELSRSRLLAALGSGYSGAGGDPGPSPVEDRVNAWLGPITAPALAGALDRS